MSMHIYVSMFAYALHTYMHIFMYDMRDFFLISVKEQSTILA